jgi:hypothetical protein
MTTLRAVHFRLGQRANLLLLFANDDNVLLLLLKFLYRSIGALRFVPAFGAAQHYRFLFLRGKES